MSEVVFILEISPNPHDFIEELREKVSQVFNRENTPGFDQVSTLLPTEFPNVSLDKPMELGFFKSRFGPIPIALMECNLFITRAILDLAVTCKIPLSSSSYHIFELACVLDWSRRVKQRYIEPEMYNIQHGLRRTIGRISVDDFNDLKIVEEWRNRIVGFKTLGIRMEISK